MRHRPPEYLYLTMYGDTFSNAAFSWDVTITRMSLALTGAANSNGIYLDMVREAVAVPLAGMRPMHITITYNDLSTMHGSIVLKGRATPNSVIVITGNKVQPSASRVWAYTSLSGSSGFDNPADGPVGIGILSSIIPQGVVIRIEDNTIADTGLAHHANSPLGGAVMIAPPAMAAGSKVVIRGNTINVVCTTPSACHLSSVDIADVYPSPGSELRIEFNTITGSSQHRIDAASASPLAGPTR